MCLYVEAGVPVLQCLRIFPPHPISKNMVKVSSSTARSLGDLLLSLLLRASNISSYSRACILTLPGTLVLCSSHLVRLLALEGRLWLMLGDAVPALGCAVALGSLRGSPMVGSLG